MKSRNWPRRYALACIISLAGWGLAAAPPPPPSPAITLLDSADAEQWRAWAKEAGWQVIAPAVSSGANIDERVRTVEDAVEEAIRNSTVDPVRVYVAGRGEATAAVFYAISRVPDLWAAGLAIGGTPQPALDSNRIYAINFGTTPVLWLGETAEDEALAKQLQSVGMDLEYRVAAKANLGEAFQWLARHSHEQTPASVDCETSSTAFARCYWVQMVKFDPTARNDVLPPTLIPGGTGASLDLGAFGYKKDAPGPGVLVSYLADKYSGPLKMGDRIVALDGRPIENAREFARALNKLDEEKAAVVMVERGKERLRLDTRVVLPRREMLATARVQARYSPEEKEIQLISRTVTEMRVTVPAAWVPGRLNWNGLGMEELKAPGCVLLKIDKELLHSAPCPK